MSQIDIFGNPIPQKSGSNAKEGLTVIENGEYIFYPNFFTKAESDSFLKNLRSNIVWKQESMNMYGKKIDFPRLTAWYGNNDKPNSFSGITLQPLPWTSEILTIRRSCEN